MQKRKSDEKGFTLIEVIVTLVLVGITAALAGMWIVSVANGYVFAKMNAGTTQKAQLAMTRLVKEFTIINSITTGSTNGTQITYTKTDSALGTTPSITASRTGGGPLYTVALGGNTLVNSVSEFALTYCDNANSTSCPSTWSSTSRIIEIKLTLTGANNTTSTFTQRVAPRNL